MNKLLAVSLPCVFLCGTALAQPIFFDDFQGPTLAPHWGASPPSHWDYNFDGGMLNITGLHFPSHPQSSSNRASMLAHFEPQSDFRADIWMGWDAGPPWHRLTVSLVGPEFQGIAYFLYTDEGPGPPALSAGTGLQGTSALAPPPGIHQFTMMRKGNTSEFLLNGIPFVSFPDHFGTPATSILFMFHRSFPSEFAHLYIDQVLIVPAPGTGAIGVLIALCAGTRRR